MQVGDRDDAALLPDVFINLRNNQNYWPRFTGLYFMKYFHTGKKDTTTHPILQYNLH